MSSTTPAEIAQAYGRRLMHKVLDDVALAKPERPLAAIMKTSKVEDGFRDVSFAEVANAVNVMAHEIERRSGKSQDFETLTYFGIPDLRYQIMFLAGVKCGYKVRCAD